MAIHAVVAHRIYRHSPNASIELQLRDELLVESGRLNEFVYELKTHFIRKGGKSYGRFSDEVGDFPFSAWLRDTREGRLSFLGFSRRVMQHFQVSLQDAESLIDAYIFFVHEALESGDILYICVVEHSSGLYLDQNMAVADSVYLDPNSVNLAARIQIGDWEEAGSNTYLTIMRSRGEKDIVDAFSHFLGFTDKRDIKHETMEFFHAVDSFNQAFDEETAKIARTKVVDYCLEQNRSGKAVVIAELSESIAGELENCDPMRFAQHVKSFNPEIKAEIIPHAGEIRNYGRISGRSELLSMSFVSDCLGREIEYDSDKEVLTIKNLPPTLKARLIKHLKETKD